MPASSRSEGGHQVLVPITRDHHGRPRLPFVQLRAVEFRGRQHTAVLTATDHDGVRDDGGGEVHPRFLHRSPCRERASVAVQALHAVVDVLFVVGSAECENVIHTSRDLPCRPSVQHLDLLLVPPVGTGIEHVDCLQACSRGSAEHPQLAALRTSHRRGARRRQRLNEHPTLQPVVVSLDAADDLRAVEAADRIDAAVQLAARAVAPGILERGAHLPLVPEAIVDLKLAKHLVVQVLATKAVELVAQSGSAEVRPLRAHGSARPPALVPNIKHLHRTQVLVAVVAPDCEDQREGEEVDAVEPRLPHQSLRLSAIPGHGGCLRVPQEVQNCPEVLRVAIDEDPAVAVAADLVATGQERLQVTAWLLHQSRSRCLEDRAADVQMYRGLRGHLRVHDSLPLRLEEAVLLAKLLVLVGDAPSLVVAILILATAFLGYPPAGFLDIALHLPELRRRLLLGAATVLADLVDLTGLLGHELLPDGELLFLESLAGALQISALLLELRLRLL
mmetsp:Transcript_7766/g.28416  ORF Transcript_7766/g.28416 Transcript_7766/m.28416 type:complete len:504 (+) Transcript_7766:45-1556(+)